MRTKFNGILTLFLALVVQISFAQDRTITGTVSDESGPLPGVSVLKKGTSTGTETDFDGNYSIKAKTGDVLIFSFVGMKNIEKIVANSNQVNVLMENDNLLDEIVVVGYGEQTEKKIIQNVSIVKEKDIEDLQVTSADQLLQGQASGVQLVNSSGVLGAASVIRVRGISTISAGSQPLIVIDGMPITDTDNTSDNGGNTGANPLSYIDPNDIGTFTVLKDAAATSIYGSRGANGVILITTKKGRKNTDAKITVDVSTQITEATDTPNILSADQWRTFRTDVHNIQEGTNLNPEDLGHGALGDPGTDWLNGVQKIGYTQRYSLSARGGSEKNSYFFGLNYQDAEGFIIGNDQERIGARVNLDMDAKSWLKLGVNMGVTHTTLNRIAVENSINAPFTTGFLQNPTKLAYDNEGNFLQSGTFIPNIFARVDLNENVLKTFRIIGNTFAEVKLFPNLKYRSEFGIDVLRLEEFGRQAEFNAPGTDGKPGGSAQQLLVNEDRWLTNQTLNYSTVFANDHNLNITAGLTYEETLRTRSNISGTEFISDDIRNLGAANQENVSFVRGEGDRDANRLYGLFSRLSYDYKGKYLVEGSFRRDGSSRFGRNNRFGNFWSVSGGWVISQEEFMNNSFFNYLSLRGSYGIVGNDRIGYLPALGLFSGGSEGNYNSQSGIIPSQPENPDLKWEESATFDIGIKSRFLNNKISLNANYFIKKTNDLLLSVPLPPQTGYNTVTANVGAMENSGFEFDLSSTNISTDNFEWKTSLNISFIDNKITELFDQAATDNEGRKILDNGNQRAIVGESLNNFFLIRYSGINPETGDAEWLDIDGNKTTTPNSNDRVVVGNPLPDFSGGITNTFRYNNFDLSFLMNYSYGNKIMINGLRFIDGFNAIGGIGNVREQNLNFWRNPGDDAFLPSPSSSTAASYAQTSTLQLKS